MSEKEKIAQLALAIESLHGAKADFYGSKAVHEKYGGETMWKGMVSTFELQGHPSAPICYAWLEPSEDSMHDRVCAVLHTTQVDSPEKPFALRLLLDTSQIRASIRTLPRRAGGLRKAKNLGYNFRLA